MSLGGVDPIPSDYLATLASFARRVQTPWHSDHLCFTVVGGTVTHELLPLPFTAEVVEHVAVRVMRAQDALGIPMAVENISYYAHPGAPEMDEADFAAAVVARAGCSLLLDVNNVYVNAKNHGFDARAMIAKMPLDRVVQIHVAGHDTSDPALILDTHAEAVRDEVYDLLAFTLQKTGSVPILLERDDNFPPWEELCAEVAKLDTILRQSTAPRDATETEWQAQRLAARQPRDGAP
jgi:uncharacterized protein (UPF0276 family)